MVSIARRPNGQWRPRYRDAAGKEHARHFEKKADAQAWLDSVTTSVLTGACVDPERTRVLAGSPRGSPAAASPMARAWTASAAWSGDASPGCTRSSGYGLAMSTAPTSSPACSRPAPLSATAGFRSF